MKTCSTCGKTKNINDFHRRKDSKDGHQGYCKTCNHAKVAKWQSENLGRRESYWRNPEVLKKQRARRYGLTSEELSNILEEANGRCKICEKERSLVIDHDHTSGLVRGVICAPCNKAIGMLGDSVEGIERVLKYLSMDRKH